MLTIKIMILAIVQGLAELLPVSSSAHVVVAEKLLGLDASSPAMTLVLVLLHTGTMLAVIVYFWRQWRDLYFRSLQAFRRSAAQIAIATVMTGCVAAAIIAVIEKMLSQSIPGAQIEDLFSHLELIAPALAAAGILIIAAGIVAEKRSALPSGSPGLRLWQAISIGAVQGVCLPFRGFSRSGGTISTGMLIGVSRHESEAFSFALAVILTPPVVAREVWRLVRSGTGPHEVGSPVLLGLLGALVAFVAGLIALRWLSRWLESGRWALFGLYCLVAAGVVAVLHTRGY